jgi:hypothetical protein
MYLYRFAVKRDNKIRYSDKFLACAKVRFLLSGPGYFSQKNHTAIPIIKFVLILCIRKNMMLRMVMVVCGWKY